MDKQELKMRLAACRPSGQDNGDSAIREALEWLPGDPEAVEWFSRSQALDQAICCRIEHLAVPAGLRERILAGARISEQKREWSRRLWLAAAAVVLAGFAVLMLEKRTLPLSLTSDIAAVASLREYRDDVASAFLKMHDSSFRLDLADSNVVKVKSWLSEHGAPAEVELRAGLNTAEPFGCKIIDWRGRRVSMMCFGKNNDEAHLFVVDRSAIRDLGTIEPGRIERVNGIEVMAWQDDKRAYVLMGDTPQTNLRQFL